MSTRLDNQNKLNKFTDNQVPQLAEKATQFAGHMVLRLVHDHLLRLDLAHYDKVISSQVAAIRRKMVIMKLVSVSLAFLFLSASPECFLAELFEYFKSLDCFMVAI